MPPKHKHNSKTTVDSQIAAVDDGRDAVNAVKPSHAKRRRADHVFDSEEPAPGGFV